MYYNFSIINFGKNGTRVDGTALDQAKSGALPPAAGCPPSAGLRGGCPVPSGAAPPRRPAVSPSCSAKRLPSLPLPLPNRSELHGLLQTLGSPQPIEPSPDGMVRYSDGHIRIAGAPHTPQVPPSPPRTSTRPPSK